MEKIHQARILLSPALVVVIMLVSFSVFFNSGVDSRVTKIFYSNLQETIVEVEPGNQTVLVNSSFTVDVYVSPAVPINGVSFDQFVFDPLLVEAVYVEEGDLFADAQNTFFNPGVINNSDGWIADVYGLTVPATSTVSKPGVFCTIGFVARDVIGMSSLVLQDVKVSDETGGQVSVTVFNGAVFVNVSKNYPPVMYDEQPVYDAEDVGIDIGVLEVMIEDPEGDLFSWSIETCPDVGNSSGVFEHNGTKQCVIEQLELDRQYLWFVNVTDSKSGEWTREVFVFTTSNQSNRAPVKPVLWGPSIVKTQVSQTYTANTTDPDGDGVAYLFDWGDGTDSGWTEYVPSGDSVSRMHAWATGNYSIRVKTRDEQGLESVWSESVNVSVSRLINISNIRIGYVYFLNVSWAYVYLFDLLDVSLVLNDRLVIKADVRENVDYVEFYTRNLIISGENMVVDENLSDGCVGAFDVFNVSHGVYEVEVIAFDGEGVQLDSDVLPIVVFFEFRQNQPSW